MALSREVSLRIRNFLDNWLPPVLRDSRLLMLPLMRFALGKKYRAFAEFKEHGFAISAEEFTRVYAYTADASQIQGDTDLNEACVAAILKNVVGFNVLDAGCGRGYLANRLTAVAPRVVGTDIVLDDRLRDMTNVEFVAGSVEGLPFADSEFDTVVCTHTLEHVQHLQLALAELRRVARQRLIIVVPRERAYRYSFNLHLHFFPYPWSWFAVAGQRQGATLEDLGDWLYVEDQPRDAVA